MKIKLFLTLIFVLLLTISKAQDENGMYTNPILFADYSDPDVIRVKDDYYMVASSFTAFPGIPILHSKDLVNWKIINHVYQKLPFSWYNKPKHGKGAWAPSIRYHKGMFYVYVCSPDEGLFMARTADPARPWELFHVADIAQWEDPCPFWDEDGNAYLAHSKLAGGLAVIHKMSTEGTKLLDNGVIVYQNKVENPTLEGLKLMKRNGYYYIFAPAGGVSTGWQTVLRSKNIYGPYESKKVLDQGDTDINGPHQGGFVDTQTGEWWFIHFQDRDAFGRIAHLQPGKWLTNDWPVIGMDDDGDGCGSPVKTFKKPNVGKTYPVTKPQTSDDFNSAKLGLQWQWQANSNPSWYSLSAKPGSIRLFAANSPTELGNLWYAGNLLLQKVSAPEQTFTTKLFFNPSDESEMAGITVFGQYYTFLCLRQIKSQLRLSLVESGFKADGFVPKELFGVAIKQNQVWLKGHIYADQTCSYSYSLNGKDFTEIPQRLKITKGRWVGAKIGIACVNPNLAPVKMGFADFDFFEVEDK
ncbi:glycosyl hydrolase 43 family protein [Pedobacter frigiditerrae]|uniref:Glycosyl hydrolase 43 family protein n=1 Tax=Pedobacter frigiditerrae TaxID=2530452 RepID=A0A4R0MP47_9SPHI|nr:glycoside hydrolase 43 family protein [Pedobacter frigiditerrae]TCC88609.1 glycosyl hydrolase 43 family protein [Pedobacter frigiditerrae]